MMMLMMLQSMKSRCSFCLPQIFGRSDLDQGKVWYSDTMVQSLRDAFEESEAPKRRKRTTAGGRGETKKIGSLEDDVSMGKCEHQPKLRGGFLSFCYMFTPIWAR